MSFMKISSDKKILFIVLLSGCIDREVEDRCAEFVEYVCTCHAKNPDYSCTELKNIYQNAKTEKQEECALQFDDLIYEDTKNNLQCTLNQQSQDVDQNSINTKKELSEKKTKKNKNVQQQK